MASQLDFSEFVDDVRAEAAEHLRVLDAQLLQLERTPTDPVPLRQMFLSAHTIKGCAAMVALTEISVLAHAIEDVLTYLRDTHQPLDTVTADLLYQSLDTLRALVESAAPGASGADPSITALADLLRRRTHAAPSPDQEIARTGDVPVPDTELARDTAQARRVLVVEDSPTVRLLETMLLTEAGFEVEAIADGQEALARATAHTYQLLVTGVETRGLRGPDLAVALRATPAGRRLPIIIMTSNDDDVARRQAAEADVQAYIRKGSFGRQRLVETARALVAPTASP